MKNVKWKPPDQGVIKINFDGALFRDSGATGLGFTHRDYARVGLAYCQRHVTHISCPEVAEALSACEAPRLGLHRGWNHVILEGDCLSLINHLQSSVYDFSS